MTSKNKKWFCVHWKKKAIKVEGRLIQLSNGKGRQGIVFKLPVDLTNCQPNTVELIWRNGYWLSITLEIEGKQQVLGFNTAAIDMLASLTDAWRFAGLTELLVKSTQSLSRMAKKLKSFLDVNFVQSKGIAIKQSENSHESNLDAKKALAAGNDYNLLSPK